MLAKCNDGIEGEIKNSARMRNCEGLRNQGWGLDGKRYVSCLEGCVSVKWVEREGRMGVQRQMHM